jgi:molybdate transport system substrate-binding protein
VYAAASLRDAFTRLSEEFRKANPGVELTFNFAGSQELRTQIQHGATADVFASADERNMALLVKSGRVQGPVVFARNDLVIVIAKEKVAAVQTVADLARVERLVLGAHEVPVGSYTEQMLERAARRFGNDFRTRIAARVVSRELNVRQVLAKVMLGEADAGIVYRTDATAQHDAINVVTIDPDLNVIAEYPIGVVSGTAQPHLSAKWVSLVRSPIGRRVLESLGFKPALAESVP